MLFEYLTDKFGNDNTIMFVSEYLMENYDVRYNFIENLDEFYGEHAIDLAIALGKGSELMKDYFTYDGYGWIVFLDDWEVIDELKQYEDELLEAIKSEDEYIIDSLGYLNMTIDELKKELKEYDN